MKQVSLGAAIVGGLMFVLSLLWGFMFPPGSGWTQEKASRMSELSKRAHVLHMKVKMNEKNPGRAGEDAGAVAQEYREVTAELKSLKEELESKKKSPQLVTKVLRFAGLIVGVLGLVGLRSDSA